MRRTLRFAAALAVLLIAGSIDPGTAFAQHLPPGGYLWYVPEHEGFDRTAFYSKPSFNSEPVHITRTQRFRYGPVWKGWAELEFDVRGKVFIHLRVLRTLVYDPAASDPWYEFKRASVFLEEPQKIEARLKSTVAPAPAVTDSKTPSWKRYKESWGIRSGRPAPAVSEDQPPDAAPSRAGTTSPTTKPRSKYPLLTPLGGDQPRESAPTDAAGQDAEAPGSR